MLQTEMRLADQPEDEMLTCAQVAKQLSVSVATVTRWVQQGYFPNAWRINPRAKKSFWRIPKRDIEAFFELRRTRRGFFYLPPETKAE